MGAMLARPCRWLLTVPVRLNLVATPPHSGKSVVGPRDVALLAHLRANDDGSFDVVMKSVNDAKLRQRKEYTRAELLLSLFHVVPIDDTSCEGIFLFCFFGRVCLDRLRYPLLALQDQHQTPLSRRSPSPAPLPASSVTISDLCLLL